MTTTHTILSRVRISDVWRGLGGGELRLRRGRAFWRGGDGYCVAVDDARGIWWDHRDGEGGGVLDLIQHVRGGSRADALKFVAELAGLTLDSRPLSMQEKRTLAERLRQAAHLARQCAWWVRARSQELERTKATAYEHGAWDSLAWSARELYLLQTAVAGAHMDCFLKAIKADPKGAASLVQAGRDDEWHAHAIAVAITIMIAEAAIDQK